jgi:hypothetical protein
MSTEEFIIVLFDRVDDAMRDLPKHPQAALYPSELMTLALLYARKGDGARRFYRWLVRDYRPLFPHLPERTRLFRLFTAHQEWAARFLADPTILGVADTYGVAFIHPRRDGRSGRQQGKKGLSNRRWIVGGKLGVVLNQWGLVTAWDCRTANVHDSSFQPLVARFAEEMIVLTDHGFHAKAGDPPNMKVCAPRTWNVRMMVETVCSMVTTICDAKGMRHRLWATFTAHLASLLAVFNVLVQWEGLKPDDEGRIHLAIAEFSL